MSTLTPGVVFPTNAPYNTVPHYSGTFIPNLWAKKLLIKLYENLMLSEIVNTEYEGQFKNQGDTIRIRSAPDVTIRDYEIGTNLQYEVPTPVYQDMQIDQGKYFGVKVADVYEYQSDMDLMNMFTEEASKQLKIAIENEVFFDMFVTAGPNSANMGATAGALTGAYNLGTDTVPIDQTSANDVLHSILRMSSVLDEQNVPEDGRWLIISPYVRHILLQSNIAASYFSGDSTSMVRTGKIGTIDRFTCYVSNLLPRAEAGKAFVPAKTSTALGADVADARKRHLMVAGTKHAISFAATIEKTEPMRDPTDFGDIVRGLTIYGRKVVKDECLVTTIVGDAA